MPNPVIFKDIDRSFMAHPVTGNLKVVINLDAIKAAVENTVLLNKYEIPYNPSDYSGISGLLFNQIDSTTVGFLQKRIETAIKNYEPRANVLSIDVFDLPSEHLIQATITFSAINQLQPQTVTVFLQKIR